MKAIDMCEKCIHHGVCIHENIIQGLMIAGDKIVEEYNNMCEKTGVDPMLAIGLQVRCDHCRIETIGKKE